MLDVINMLSHVLHLWHYTLTQGNIHLSHFFSLHTSSQLRVKALLKGPRAYQCWELNSRLSDQ